jgi:hypothetical protein
LYLRECIGLLTKEERISMVQSSSWITPEDCLSPEGVHRSLDKGGENIHCAIFFIENG